MCVNYLSFISCILLLGIASVSSKQGIPAGLERCKFGDETCYVEQAQQFFALYKQGYPERKIPPLETLYLGDMHLNIGQPGSAFQFNLLLTNTTLNNFASTLLVKSFKGFPKQVTKAFKLLFMTYAAQSHVRAQYDVNGKILLLPIVSKGDIDITLKNVTGKARITVEPVQKADGHTYLKIIEYKTALKSAAGSFELTNFFPHNKELRESTLNVLNNEWDALNKEIQPQIVAAMDRFFTTTVQLLMENVPYEEFFLEE